MKEYNGSKVVKHKQVKATRRNLARAILGKNLGKYPSSVYWDERLRKFGMNIEGKKILDDEYWIYLTDKKTKDLRFIIEVKNGVAKTIREFKDTEY